MARIQQPQGMAASRGHTVMDSFKDEVPQSLQNSFIAGLKTEFTGLNFPPNSCTDVDNCVFTMLGDILRREGFDYEANFITQSIDRTGMAVNTYRWLNVGGDGETQFYVLQVGNLLYFFNSSAATVASPLSTQMLLGQVDISAFLANGGSGDPSVIECQFSDGNGYLFVYHPLCDTFSCTFSNGNISANIINIQTRDFVGYQDGLPVDFRPSSLTSEHTYNLQNQGWTKGSPWAMLIPYLFGTVTQLNGPAIGFPGGTNNSALIIPVGIATFNNAPSGIPVVSGSPVSISTSNMLVSGQASNSEVVNLTVTTTATGTVVSYSGTTLIIDINTAVQQNFPTYGAFSNGIPGEADVFQGNWNITASSQVDLIDSWQTAIGNYPANSDVWWRYKDETDVFNPAVTEFNVPIVSSPAPSGHFIVNTFNQQQDTISGIAGITSLSTLARPRTGAWFQGRVWFAGVDASQPASGDQQYYTWTENLYFSQIVTDTSDFGLCYQTNDPTDENLFNLLPTDGGVIVIQGCGAIYKLYPIQNGMLVFAANGIWFITGSQGIGFTANDYTVTKISSVRSFSGTSFVDVQGLPVFWNEEGIYTIQPAQQGLGLTVNPLTLGTILTFYNSIPMDSKRYARGAYNPITYVLEWVYRSTQETDVTSRYTFDRVLCLNTFTKAFYPYSLAGTPSVNGIQYISSPGGSGAPEPVFKYLVSEGTNITFAEERDTNYIDWKSFDGTGTNYSSFFITGYQLDGQGMRKWQPQYIYVYSRNTVPTSYKIQGIWDYGSTGNSGQLSVQQVTNSRPYFGMVFKRHRIRGHGYVLQLKFTSVDSAPFDIMGWAMFTTQNTGP
jgi:hypothetical protein